MTVYVAKDIRTLEHEKFTDKAFVKVIDPHHDAVHRGEIFSHDDLHSLGAGGTLDHLILTSLNNSTDIHSLVITADGSPVMVYVYEAPTITLPGTTLPWFNHNRLSSAVPETVLSQGPAVSAVGTLFITGLITGGTFSGGGAVNDDEWMLKPNTYYLIRIVNNTIQSVNLQTHFSIHEELLP